MSTTQDETTLPALEEMSTEEFLVWMLENCPMDEEEARKARLLMNTFFIVQTVKADFDVQLVAESYPKLNALNNAWRLPA